MNRIRFCDICGGKSFKKICDLKSDEGFLIKECSSCKFVILDPKPHTSFAKSLFNEEYYASNPEYFSWGKEKVERYRKILQSVRRISPIGRLLDIGCGLGVFLDVAREKGWDVQGLDISEYAASYCKEKYDVPVMTGSIIGNCKENYFDVITLFDVVEHMDPLMKQLQEAKKCLKKGGLLVITAPNENGLAQKLSRFLYRASFGYLRQGVDRCYIKDHLYYFSKKTLTKMLKDRLDFEIVVSQGIERPIDTIYWASPLQKMFLRGLFAIGHLLSMQIEMLVIARK